MRLDARSNEPVSKADGPWVTETEAAAVAPESSEFVGPDADVKVVEAVFCTDFDGSGSDTEAARSVDVVDSGCASGSDIVLAGPEVSKAPLAWPPDDEETAPRPRAMREFWVVVLDVSRP